VICGNEFYSEWNRVELDYMEFYSMLIICASMELNLDILLKYIKAYSWSRPKSNTCVQAN
jgi:hypothetical protein